MKPKKWMIKVTKENKEIVYSWLEKQPNINCTFGVIEGYFISSIPRRDNSYQDWSTEGDNAKLEGCKEITFEEFKWWVLGEFPERWYIALTDLPSDQRKIVGDFYNKSCSDDCTTYSAPTWKRLYSHNNVSKQSILGEGRKGYSFANNNTEGYIEISFDEFKKFVIKQEVAPIDEFNKYGIEVGDTIKIVTNYEVKEVDKKGIRLVNRVDWSYVNKSIESEVWTLIKKPKEEKIPEFTLPAEWFVHTSTPEEDAIVVEYFNKTFGSHMGNHFPEKGFWYSNSPRIKDYYYSAIIPSKGTEITFEQFKTHVLKSSIMKKEIVGYKLIK